MDLKLTWKHLWTVPFPRSGRKSVPERKFGCSQCKSKVTSYRVVCRVCSAGFCRTCTHKRSCWHEDWLQQLKTGTLPKDLYVGPVIYYDARHELKRKPYMFERLRQAGYLTASECAHIKPMKLKWAKKLILDGTITVGSEAWKTVSKCTMERVPAFHASLLLADPTMIKPDCYDSNTWNHIRVVVDEARRIREHDIAVSVGVSVYVARLICTYL